MLLGSVAVRPASAEEDVIPLAKLSRDPQPARVVVTGKLPPKESAALQKDPAAAPEWRGRAPMAQDANGTPRSPDEPRFVTGSLVKQRFNIYGNSADTASKLEIYDQNDLRRGGFGDLGLGAPVPESPAHPVLSPAGAERTAAANQRRYVLDLRKVPAARRLAVATQLLGPERGKRLVDEFNEWQTKKNRRSSRLLTD